MQAIAAAIPNAEFVVIPNSGHMTTMENPEAVNEALLKFVDRLSGKVNSDLTRPGKIVSPRLCRGFSQTQRL